MKSINLLPPKKNVGGQSPLLVPLLIVALLLGLGAQGFYYAMWSNRLDTTAERIERMDHDIANMRDAGIPLAAMEGYKQAKQWADELERQRLDWTPYLQTLVDELPAKAKIATINAEGGSKLDIELDFPTYAQVLAYMEALEGSNRLNQVRLTSFYKRTESEPVKKSVFKLLLTLDVSKIENGGTN